MRVLYLVSGAKGEGGGKIKVTFLFLQFSRILLSENIHYVKVPYFGVVYPEPCISGKSLSIDPAFPV